MGRYGSTFELVKYINMFKLVCTSISRSKNENENKRKRAIYCIRLSKFPWEAYHRWEMCTEPILWGNRPHVMTTVCEVECETPLLSGVTRNLRLMHETQLSNYWDMT